VGSSTIRSFPEICARRGQLALIPSAAFYYATLKGSLGENWETGRLHPELRGCACTVPNRSPVVSLCGDWLGGCTLRNLFDRGARPLFFGHRGLGIRGQGLASSAVGANFAVNESEKLGST